MTEGIQLIVGLGNPGAEYEQTRHNAGAWFVEALARHCGVSLRPDNKYHGLYAKARFEGHDLHLLIPTTFMNLSGQATVAVSNFFKIPASAILVAHDEMDIPTGTARFKHGGGHGGHNGLRDIISKLGNEKGFNRLRLGIGHPGSSDKVTGYVLGRAPKAEQQALNDCIDEAIRALPDAVKGQWAPAMNRLHSFKPA
ncbi:peptidyl-tRNA hydrolase [Oceanospirillum multiglobuliferum]|uniref:Peptidyl-tRNA hydrolase n=1 Tax=Oceanospirillum multiglobuliferum TaxID=64969 RepID=A0A1T4LF88_9GAMM|nr:aminoacyl-tRNA hydrolase [Oceanospirillum multiglobuliferum]OPX56688.1 aminoacyl-tRNA hydrolase [Oceanospirillum multiglobuliferum]SJZ53134.1 peptidyl-tRNA hydrolase [Oceanospirillum multiglobuliferum]